MNIEGMSSSSADHIRERERERDSLRETRGERERETLDVEVI